LALYKPIQQQVQRRERLILNVASMMIRVFLDDNVFNDSYRHFMGHAVAQLVEALRYKPEGRGFDFRWCHWNFSLT
jgi:hypothetical protein